MVICGAGEIAIVPLPFGDIAFAKPRPALALSPFTANESCGNTIFAMITTAVRSRWPQDVALSDGLAAGLTAASIVRFKLFTLDNRLVSRKIGHLTAPDRKAVRRMLQSLLAV